MARFKPRPESAPGAPVTVEVFRIPLDGEVIVRWLAEPRGILQHWDKTRGRPCPGEKECGAAHYKNFPIWVGFAAVERWRGGQWSDWCPCALQVSEALQERIAGHVLRGTIWKLWRAMGRSSKMECTGEEIGEINPDSLPRPFSVEPAVFKVFKTTRIQFDVEPPMPSRVVVSASAGAPPPSVTKPNEPRIETEREKELREYEEAKKARREKNGVPVVAAKPQ